MKDITIESAFRLFDDWSLTALVKYHNNIRGMIGEQFHRIDDEDQDYKKETLERYALIKVTSCFLMAYAHLEEALINLWMVKLGRKPPPNNAGIDRHKELFTSLGVNLGECSVWPSIKDASDIRHCILHANGRLDFMRNKDKMEKMVARYTNDIEIVNGRILVQPEYLRTFHKSIKELRDQLLDA